MTRNEHWPAELIQSCPRCANRFWGGINPDDSLWFDDHTAGCYKCNHSESRKTWDTRPIEARVKRLEEALKEIKSLYQPEAQDDYSVGIARAYKRCQDIAKQALETGGEK